MDIRKIIKESLAQPGKVVKVDEETLTEPSSFVQKYEGGEEKWKKAKEIASKEGKGENYGYITGIFKKMVGESDDLEERLPNTYQSSPYPGQRGSFDVSPPAKPIMPDAKKPESKPEHKEPKDTPPTVAEGAEEDEKEMKKEDKLHNPSHSLWTAPKGFYQRPATEIARTLIKVSGNQKQAMARLMFYLNRSGEDVAPADMKRLTMAKELIAQTGEELRAKESEKEEEEQ